MKVDLLLGVPIFTKIITLFGFLFFWGKSKLCVCTGDDGGETTRSSVGGGAFYPSRVTIRSSENGELGGKVVILPNSMEELLKVGEEKMGFLPTKVLTREGAEIDDITLVRDGDCLILARDPWLMHMQLVLFLTKKTDFVKLSEIYSNDTMEIWVHNVSPNQSLYFVGTDTIFLNFVVLYIFYCCLLTMFHNIIIKNDCRVYNTTNKSKNL